ncbi:serine--tRNA ligase [Deinococcus roseus]|uniref:Serine--tRNA ligase n=1 Tax=Deinococcus roseus TaxID=392414 RepID=A0ABQ2DHK4_9DEIO|nr:serine--tRNA ligase [Deinococcus roseus]GGJ57901.1 serine--tRNA ligase [Deinococcus roseus]
MLDLKFIRENPETVREAIKQKRVNLDLAELLAADQQLSELKKTVEARQAERNQNAKLVPKASPEERPALIQKGKDLGEELRTLEADLREKQEELRLLLLKVPNVPLAGVPVGRDDEENVEVRREGELPSFDFEPKDHITLLQQKDWADFDRVGNVSGSRSYLLKGDMVLLEMALMNFAMTFLSGRGFTPMGLSALVRGKAFEGTGHFPGGEDQVYKVEGQDLMLAGTAEVPANELHRDMVLSEDQLPLTYAAISGAFRSEAGSAGRDVKGLIRVHEFKKVEQYVICRGDIEESQAWFYKLLSNAEALMKALELPYRVIQNCTGDMGAGKVWMYDIETWVPSEQKYRETHSCSNLGDWQARRTNIRYKDREGKMQFPHTLNNTGIASPRILVPFLENHQQADGSIRIPAALQPFLGGRTQIG